MIDSLQFGSFRAKSRGPNGFTAFRTAAGAQAFRPFSLVHRKLKTKMPRKSYTLFIAANDSGGVRRLRIPLYAVQLLLVLSLVGGATVIFAAGSYSRMLWKVGNYNALRREQTNLKKQYRQLQTQVSDTNQRLNSLQSLATEVAVAYGITRFRQTPFGLSEPVAGPEGEFQQSVDQYNFLQTNASLMNGSNQSLHLLPTGSSPTSRWFLLYGLWSVKLPGDSASGWIRLVEKVHFTLVWTSPRGWATRFAPRRTA